MSAAFLKGTLLVRSFVHSFIRSVSLALCCSCENLGERRNLSAPMSSSFRWNSTELTQLHMETLASTSVFVFVNGNHVNWSLSSLADSSIVRLAIECPNRRGSPSNSMERYIGCIDSFTFVSCIVFWSLLCWFGCPLAIVRRMMGWYQVDLVSVMYRWHCYCCTMGYLVPGTIR